MINPSSEGVQAGDEREEFEAAEREINSRVDLSVEWRTEEYANPWVMDRWRTWRRAWKARAALASEAEDAKLWRWMRNHAENVSFSYQVDPITRSTVMGLHCGSLKDAVASALKTQADKDGGVKS